MKFDVFFSICQTPVGGSMPDETGMFRNFFAEVEAADELGYECAWIAESHLSTAAQQSHPHAVVPHFQGEVGLNVDFLQLSHAVFHRTRNIECGSAVMNILCNGGPIAAAERIAAFLTLHGLDPVERRRIRVGFAAGRFDFMNRAYCIDHRDAVEEAAWPVLKGQIFREACDIFLKLLRGDQMSSDQVVTTALRREQFRDDAHWRRVGEAYTRLHGEPPPGEIPIARRWPFEELKIIPGEWRRELLDLVLGSHDPRLQAEMNRILPVKVFNLSITAPDIIQATHERMSAAYHPSGGPWLREYMPRTTMVFLNAEPGLTARARSGAAREEAEAALRQYWNALEGTIDPDKVARATENALVGNPEEVAAQLRERFHRDDRVMLWFDFYNHDAARVMRNMEAFRHEVMPRLAPGAEDAS